MGGRSLFWPIARRLARPPKLADWPGAEETRLFMAKCDLQWS